MQMSEYIQVLQDMLKEHGDHECIDSFEDEIGDPEFNDDNGAVFVMADRA